MIAACAAGASCAGGHGAGAPPPSAPHAGSGSGLAPVTDRERSPTADECDALLRHVVELAGELADRERDAVLAREREGTAARDCRALRRAVYACAIAATTLDAVTACE